MMLKKLLNYNGKSSQPCYSPATVLKKYIRSFSQCRSQFPKML